VLNELIDHRGRRRWRVLAQYVLLALVQDARVTWTSIVEQAEQRDLGDDSDALLAAARRALDTAALSTAIASLLADDERRPRLGEAIATISRHAGAVIRSWAAVMVGSGPYTDVFDRHVELQSRLDWLSEFLAHRDPDAQRSIRDAKLARSSVASEHYGVLAGDERLRDQLVATTQLAVRLDYESRKLAFELVPFEWWESRTAEVVHDLAVLEPR